MFEQLKLALSTVKTRTIVLGLGILLTFGLIAAAAPSLPNNAEARVTAPRQGRGPRGNGNRPNRPQRDNQLPQPIDDFFDF
ncbi:MAG: hypothetical protein AB8G95_19580 [Anaerolineae bacterium]